ncbi:MAG: hypothetical protein AAGM27_07685, partial [Cyanobacteria bacterium J06554_3]
LGRIRGRMLGRASWELVGAFLGAFLSAFLGALCTGASYLKEPSKQPSHAIHEKLRGWAIRLVANESVLNRCRISAKKPQIKSMKIN